MIYSMKVVNYVPNMTLSKCNKRKALIKKDKPDSLLPFKSDHSKKETMQNLGKLLLQLLFPLLFHVGCQTTDAYKNFKTYRKR